MSVVLKFGGTSVADAAALRRVIAIVLKEQAASGGVVCVLSATSGTTNFLLALAKQSAMPSAVVSELCEPIRTRHHQIVVELIDSTHQVKALQLVDNIVDELERYCHGMHVLEECTNESLDAVASIGERLTTTILTCALQSNGINAQEVAATQIVKTTSDFTQAQVVMADTRLACKSVLIPLLDRNTLVVTQGFAGSDSRGHITTLGRGGSDASAAIIGAAVGAERIEIWTDVSGVYSADPRRIPSAKAIASLSFGEVRELALYGAKVLHPDTIVPAVEEDIPVLIKNTFQHDASGTIIQRESNLEGTVQAVSLLQPCLLVAGERSELLRLPQNQLLQRRGLLNSSSYEHGMAVYHIPDPDTRTEVDVAIAGSALRANECAVLICTGPGVTHGDVLRSITASVADLDTKAIVAGASPWSVFVVVATSDADVALVALHRLTE